MRMKSLKTFLTFIDIGPDSKALKQLGVSRTTIWNHVNAIESTVNRKLINRTNKKSFLTDDAQSILPHLRSIMEEYEKMEQSTSDRVDNHLVISSTESINNAWLVPFIEYLSKRNPEITLNVICENDLSEYVDSIADIFIRPIHSSSRLFWEVDHNFGLFATKEYLDNHEPINTPEDLKKHKMIAYDVSSRFKGFKDINWHITGLYDKRLPKIKPHLTVNSHVAIKKMGLAGLGIMAYPIDFHDPSLVRVLPEIHGPTIPVGCFEGRYIKKSKRPALETVIQNMLKFFDEKMAADPVRKHMKVYYPDTN